MEDSIGLLKDFVSLLVPIVTGYLVLFSGSIGKLWLEHKSDLIHVRVIILLAGLSVVVGLLSISILMGTMSLLLKATYGTDQETFWRGTISSQELVEYAHVYLINGWTMFTISMAFGFSSYLMVLKESLTNSSS